MTDYSDEDFEAAARYVRHDYGRKTIASVLEEYGLKKPEVVNPDDPKPPPPSDDPKSPATKKSKGLWWPKEADADA